MNSSMRTWGNASTQSLGNKVNNMTDTNNTNQRLLDASKRLLHWQWLIYKEQYSETYPDSVISFRVWASTIYTDILDCINEQEPNWTPEKHMKLHSTN